ncbi:MAG TPA: hypothetical protein VF161_00890 [Steroidobacteraceae bacterium]
MAASGIPYGGAPDALGEGLARNAVTQPARNAVTQPADISEALAELLGETARPYNGFRTIADEQLADRVLNLVLDHERTKYPLRRARSAAALAEFRDHVLAMFADVVHCWLTHGPRRAVHISKDNTRRVSRYSAPGDKPWQRNKVFELFKSLGWIKVVAAGSHLERRRTVIQATPELVRLAADLGFTAEGLPLAHRRVETVVSKGPPKDAEDAEQSVWLEYRDEDAPFDIRAEREVIRDLNAWLASARIEYTDADTAHLVDLSRRTLRRFYWRDWTGSRIFGDAFWMAMPRTREGVEYPRRGAREFLRINGHRAVTLDFAACMPRLAFARVGHRLDRAPYAVPGFEQYRDGIKKVFAALLFCKGKLARWPKDARALFPEGTRIGAVVSAIERHLPELRPLFGAEVGHELFRVESDILLDVLVRLRAMNIHALPIHDAVIVGEPHAEIAKAVMLEAFERRTGQPGAVEREETKSASTAAGASAGTSVASAVASVASAASPPEPKIDHAELRALHRGVIRSAAAGLPPSVDLACFVV